jgi:hypothetical protein
MGAIQCTKTIWFLRLGVLSLCLIPFSLSAQITFERTYGDTNRAEQGHCIQQTQDGGYVVVGSRYSFGSQWDVYLLKIDSLGDTLWTRTHGDTSRHEYGRCVQQTADGGYIIVGGCDALVWLLRTDHAGDTLWTRTYGEYISSGESVDQTLDGGYVITGHLNPDPGNGDVYLIRTDSLGDTLWTRTYGGNGFDRGQSVQQTPDGGYITAGFRRGLMNDVWLLRTDCAGERIWRRVYGDTVNAVGESGWSVQQTRDGGYVIAGFTCPYQCDVFIVKTDSSGDTLWTRSYGGASDDRGYSVQQTSDGGYIIAGFTESFSAGFRDVYLIRTDSLGNALWERVYGGSENDWGYSVQQTLDGGYIVAGYTNSFGTGSLDFYIIKTDQNGLTGMNEDVSGPQTHISNVRLLQNLPNPVRNSTIISYSLPHQVNWNRRDNPSGVYFYSLRAGEFVETRKMVVVE